MQQLVALAPGSLEWEERLDPVLIGLPQAI